MLYLIQQTESFAEWHAGLRDLRVRVAIARRIERFAAGLLGDVKPIGGKVSELRVDIGPGYRVYFTLRGRAIVVLRAGGDKRAQDSDIRRAHKLAREIAGH